MQWHTAIFWISLVLVASYALWRGGWPERVAALLFVLAALSSAVLRSEWTSRYRSVESGVLAVDLSLLVALIVLSLQADRLWPMACAALQAISSSSHLARWIDPDASRTAYMLVGTISGTPSLLILAIGVVRHRRRLGSTWSVRSWKTSSGLSRVIQRASRGG